VAPAHGEVAWFARAWRGIQPVTARSIAGQLIGEPRMAPRRVGLGRAMLLDDGLQLALKNS
jgi:hypothetical protein